MLPSAMDRILKQIHKSSQGPITCIIHGGARGADHMAGLWARKHDINMKQYPADWDKHGNAAGPIRNAQMLAEGFPDICVAFPGGRSCTTARLIRQGAAVCCVRMYQPEERR
jgi:hypothetical protein